MDAIRILIVDDEEDLVGALAERLTLRGFDVETATSGADGLDHLAQREFGVVLLDIKMPGIDGLELLAEIKEKHPASAVILFTGHSSLADAEKGIREGAFGYLEKPVDIEKLIEEVRRAVDTEKGQRS
jgi:DNA-binding NtrC family response regulator